MYAPIRRESEHSRYMSDWALAWLDREGGWASRIDELAAFNPIEARRIRRECTILEIARSWKTMKALSDYAWNERK